MGYIDTPTARGHGSPVVAALLAGPVFAIGMSVAGWMQAPAEAIDPHALLPILLFLLPPVWLIGMLLAIVPTFAGTAMMRWAGRGNFAMQMPVAWALAGALAAGGVTAAFAQDSMATVAMSITGGCCALICRWRVRW